MLKQIPDLMFYACCSMGKFGYGRVNLCHKRSPSPCCDSLAVLVELSPMLSWGLPVTLLPSEGDTHAALAKSDVQQQQVGEDSWSVQKYCSPEEAPVHFTVQIENQTAKIDTALPTADLGSNKSMICSRRYCEDIAAAATKLCLCGLPRQESCPAACKLPGSHLGL